MKKSEIQQGKIYLARVSGKLVRVLVNQIREASPLGTLTDKNGRVKPPITVYDVTNLDTQRQTTFRSAMRFHCEYRPLPAVVPLPRYEKQAGHLVNTETGKAVAPGVVCKCGDASGFCPMHGRTVPTSPLTPADLLKAEVIVAQEKLRLQQHATKKTGRA